MKRTIAEARRMELKRLTVNYTYDSTTSENLPSIREWSAKY